MLLTILYVFVFLLWAIINIKKQLQLKYLLFALFLVSIYFAWVEPNTNFLAYTAYTVNIDPPRYISYFLLLIIVVFFTPIRKLLISNIGFKVLKKTLPTIGETESIALEAGDTWWDKELFSANPDYKVLTNTPNYQLTEDERSFLDNEVNELCSLVNPYEVRQKADLTKQAWDYIKNNKFFGIVMPKKYGGLGFSHTAHSLIVSKLASHSNILGITVMVPNSLGPGELIREYGTDTQKDKYLSRLANGQEIPCFALTSNYAGSDAGGIIDTGIVCEADFNGKKVLALKLNWSKRYITLSPVATLLGLAFKAYDPDGLLPKEHPLFGKKDLGITCALVPSDTKGVDIGNRHDPLGCGFMNGPTRGEDVILPIESCVIGGIDMLGEGWKMLMECLSIGRGISLPSTANVGIQKTLLTSSVYANVRQQFGINIANLEAIGEKLAGMLIRSYIAKANCWQTTNVLDSNIVPATVSAIVKYRNTEMARVSILDAMDIQGGKAIMAGPKNHLIEGYLGSPVGITVEGANILTRNLMVFGQGVMRCHPYLFDEVLALNHSDRKIGMKLFDEVFFKHISFSINTFFKLLALKIGFNATTSYGSDATNKHHKKIKNLAIKFSFLSDLSLLIFGGTLKRKGIISGEFADALSTLYEMTAILNYYDAGKSKGKEIQLVMEQAIEQSIINFNVAMNRIVENLPVNFVVKTVFRFLLTKRISHNSIKDKNLLKLSKITSDIDWLKSNVCPDLYFSDDSQDPVNILLEAHMATIKQKPVMKKLASMGIEYDGTQAFKDFVGVLVRDKTIQESEGGVLIDCRNKIFAAISVDEFSKEEIVGKKI